jgi:hypothetical protein
MGFVVEKESNNRCLKASGIHRAARSPVNKSSFADTGGYCLGCFSIPSI